MFALWGATPPPPQTYPPHPPFSPFLFPSHSLLSDVDWIGLETGRCGEQRRRWWKWQCVCRVWIPRCAFDAFARQTRAYVTCGEGKQRARERKRETFKCLLQGCENNWKGKRLKTRKHTILNLSLVVFFFSELKRTFWDKRCVISRLNRGTSKNKSAVCGFRVTRLTFWLRYLNKVQGAHLERLSLLLWDT